MSVALIGQYLVASKVMSPSEWHQAEQDKGHLGLEILGELTRDETISTAEGYSAYAYINGWDYFQLQGKDLTDEVLDTIPAAFAREERVVPVAVTPGEVRVAVEDPSDLNLQKRIVGQVNRSVRLVFSSTDEIDQALRVYYSTSAEAKKRGQSVADSLRAERGTENDDDDVEATEIVALYNLIVETAVQTRASDIHIDRWEDGIYIRYSIDNKMHDWMQHDLSIASRLVGLIKYRAGMPSGNLVPKKGTITHLYKGDQLDLRIAVLPTAWGESITMRIQSRKIRLLEDTGFTPVNLRRWTRALANPNGLVIATGPMASGKTNLTMSSLHQLRDSGRKIITQEDPIEVKVSSGITQVSIDSNVSWEDSMPVILRSRAGILFVGEINEDRIAHAAVSAAMTGHLVLSTLHTNSAPGSIIRLREMGIRPSVLADTLRAVVAQRLPRKLCTCAVPTRPTEEQIEDFQLTAADLNTTQWMGPNPEGCNECQKLSYLGQISIHELMTFNDEMRELIIQDATTSAITQAAQRNGMDTLIHDGLDRARKGLTSLSELRTHLLID